MFYSFYFQFFPDTHFSLGGRLVTYFQVPNYTQQVLSGCFWWGRYLGFLWDDCYFVCLLPKSIRGGGALGDISADFTIFYLFISGESSFLKEIRMNWAGFVRNPNLGRDEIKNLVISWSQFCREPLPDRNFTFWEWFYRVMCLTSSDMRGKVGFTKHIS